MGFYGMYYGSRNCRNCCNSDLFAHVYCKLSTSFRKVRILLKRTLYVVVFRFFHILMIMCGVARQVYTLKSRQHERYGLWLLHALAVPLRDFSAIIILYWLEIAVCMHNETTCTSKSNLPIACQKVPYVTMDKTKTRCSLAEKGED